MSKYYTNVVLQGNHVLFRGVSNGRRVKEKITYSPTLFLPAKKSSDYKTLFNEPLEPMTFENVREARDFVVHGAVVYRKAAEMAASAYPENTSVARHGRVGHVDQLFLVADEIAVR